MSGIVTMRDLIELIMGEMFEEGEKPKEEEIQQLEDNLWRIRGCADIEDAANVLGVELPFDDYDTFGGFAVGMYGTIPEDGTSVSFETDQLKIKIEKISAHRVESTLVSVKSQIAHRES